MKCSKCAAEVTSWRVVATDRGLAEMCMTCSAGAPSHEEQIAALQTERNAWQLRAEEAENLLSEAREKNVELAGKNAVLKEHRRVLREACEATHGMLEVAEPDGDNQRMHIPWRSGVAVLTGLEGALDATAPDE